MVCQYACVASEADLAYETLGLVGRRDRAAVQDRGHRAVGVFLVAELLDQILLAPEHRVDSGFDLAGVADAEYIPRRCLNRQTQLATSGEVLVVAFVATAQPVRVSPRVGVVDRQG